MILFSRESGPFFPDLPSSDVLSCWADELSSKPSDESKFGFSLSLGVGMEDRSFEVKFLSLLDVSFEVDLDLSLFLS